MAKEEKSFHTIEDISKELKLSVKIIRRMIAYGDIASEKRDRNISLTHLILNKIKRKY